MSKAYKIVAVDTRGEQSRQMTVSLTHQSIS